jgi:2,6-dihydroxypseudooxynicotine hydrolase
MYAKHLSCFAGFAAHRDPPIELVEIPFGAQTIPAYVVPAAGVRGPAPAVLLSDGLDANKEEMFYVALALARRGVTTVAFDGPGQGAALRLQGITARHDFEVPVGACIDWLQSRKDIDRDRIGLLAASWGGYYAPRAAAFDKRVRACIALSGPYDWAEIWPDLNELTREAFRVRAKCPSPEAALKHGTSLTLKGVASNITCPLFIVAGKLDRIVPWQDAERLAREARGPVELLLIEDGNHVANNRGYRYRTQSADWMAKQLGIPLQ